MPIAVHPRRQPLRTRLPGGAGEVLMRCASASLILLAAGCSGAPRGNTSDIAANGPDAPANVSSPATAPTAGAAPKNQTAAAPGKLPPSSAEHRYVGRWAATEQLCTSGTWRFEPKRLDTAGDVSCAFDSIEKAPGGYDIRATCTAEAPPQPDTIRLRFAESAQAMLVQSRVLPSAGLIYCGPLEE